MNMQQCLNAIIDQADLYPDRRGRLREPFTSHWKPRTQAEHKALQRIEKRGWVSVIRTQQYTYIEITPAGFEKFGKTPLDIVLENLTEERDHHVQYESETVSDHVLRDDYQRNVYRELYQDDTLTRADAYHLERDRVFHNRVIYEWNALNAEIRIAKLLIQNAPLREMRPITAPPAESMIPDTEPAAPAG